MYVLLQRVATRRAKKEGAIVYGFDVRAAAKEQVESCGAKFLEVELKEECFLSSPREPHN